MTDKFTPGPWFITGSQTKYIEARIGGGMLQEIAAVGPTAADGGHGEQQEANAALIAAAPELLQALEGLLDADRAYEYGGYTESELAAINQARAAIAKARGL